MSKPRIRSESMKVRAYPVLERAIEEGVAYGWRRAHKHNDKPGEEAIREAITEAVSSAICEAFTFEEEE